MPQREMRIVKVSRSISDFLEEWSGEGEGLESRRILRIRAGLRKEMMAV